MVTELASLDGEQAHAMHVPPARRACTTGWRTPHGGTPDPAAPIALEELALAISHCVGLSEEDAERDAALVLDIFGFNDRVIDNVLERPDRQLFYILEEEGLLTTDREENTIWDGREWRTHYWEFRKPTIRRFVEEGRQARQRRALDPAEAVYDSLPAEMWNTARI